MTDQELQRLREAAMPIVLEVVREQIRCRREYARPTSQAGRYVAQAWRAISSGFWEPWP